MTTLIDTPNGLTTPHERLSNANFGAILDAVRVIGNGDLIFGERLMREIADRLGHARGKHPWPAHTNDAIDAALVVCDEAEELLHAAKCEPREREHDEALDVIATAVRFCNREWEIWPDAQAVTSPPCDK